MARDKFTSLGFIRADAWELFNKRCIRFGSAVNYAGKKENGRIHFNRKGQNLCDGRIVSAISALVGVSSC